MSPFPLVLPFSAAILRPFNSSLLQYKKNHPKIFWVIFVFLRPVTPRFVSKTEKIFQLFYVFNDFFLYKNLMSTFCLHLLTTSLTFFTIFNGFFTINYIFPIKIVTPKIFPNSLRIKIECNCVWKKSFNIDFLFCTYD